MTFFYLQQQQTQTFVAQNAAGNRTQFIQRSINPVQQQQVVAQQQQQPMPPQQQQQQMQQPQQIIKMPNQMDHTLVKQEGCSVPLFKANLQAPPPIPPDNIITEQDRQVQIMYEQWLNNQDNMLNNQRKYYDVEISKLRKTKKSLNSKQRALKKAGNDLAEPDSDALNRVTYEHNIVQKQLDSTRKQLRQHGTIMTDYKNKQANSAKSAMARQQMMVSVDFFSAADFT